MPAFTLRHDSRALPADETDASENGLGTPPIGRVHPKFFEASRLETENSEPLNVIIPIGGIGSRFQKEGYRFPKPLINIVGRPMICWLIERLSLRPQDTLWVAVNEMIDNDFQVGQLFKKWFPRLDIRLLRLSYLTKGATETLYIISQSMPRQHLERKTVSLDCDTIYFADVLDHVRKMPKTYGGCFYFEDTGSEPIFSYIRTNVNDNGLEVIHDIQEKKAISNKANSGAYVFPSAKALNQSAARLLDSKLDQNNDKIGEYFTSQLIEMMIVDQTAPFMGIKITPKDFSCVGTPRQLRQFLHQITFGDNPGVAKPKKQRFCFDLDMTLVGVPDVPGDYSTCPPIWRNIELVRALYRSGHHIIIQTARRMRTHHGNVGAVIADIGTITFEQLKKYDIPYHEVFFGKPWAHIYVDDLAVNANLDTHRELGWIAEDEGDEVEVSLSVNKGAKKAGIVASRDFNHVQIVGDKVIKSSRSKGILGEMYFYTYLPAEITSLFPKVYSLSHVEETAMFSFTMQKLDGTNYSHMSAGRALTPGRFQFMLRELSRIHESPGNTEARLEIPTELAAVFQKNQANKDQTPNIYANYSKKLRQRYSAFRAEYDALDPKTTQKIMRILATRLDSYEAENRGIAVPIIHGDPVFSNVVLNEKNKQVYFFDMRCNLDGTLCPAGDVCYDLAKVLQSLMGYDYIILADDDVLQHLGSPADGSAAGNSQRALDALILPADKNLLSQLQTQVFWPFVAQQYNDRVRRQDLLDITASLLFSLLPLHKPSVRPLFLQMCENIIEYGVAWPIDD